MTTQTVQTVGTGLAPRVNLMPPEIAEAERFRRLQLAMGGAVLLAAVLVGGLYVHSKSAVSSAQSQVNSAQAQQTTLQQRLNSLASVKQTYAEVAAKQTMLTQAMGQEIRWSYVLNDLSFRMPGGVWLTGVTASETDTGVTPTQTSSTSASSGTPTLAPTGIGTITFGGVALSHDDVATWLDALAREKGFTDPTFSSTAESLIGSRKVDNFSSSVVLNNNALSNRYTHEAGS